MKRILEMQEVAVQSGKEKKLPSRSLKELRSCLESETAHAYGIVCSARHTMNTWLSFSIGDGHQA